MDEQLNEMMIQIITKTAKIETELDAHKEILNKIERNVAPITEKVHRHEVIIKGFTWFMGIVVSFFSMKFLVKF